MAAKTNMAKRQEVRKYLSMINSLTRHCVIEEYVTGSDCDANCVKFQIRVADDPFLRGTIPVVSQHFEDENAILFRDIFKASPVYNNDHTIFWTYEAKETKEDKGKISARMFRKFKAAIDAWRDYPDSHELDHVYTRDREQLKVIYDYCKKGEYERAYALTCSLDTIVREVIPVDIFNIISNAKEW